MTDGVEKNAAGEGLRHGAGLAVSVEEMKRPPSLFSGTQPPAGEREVFRQAFFDTLDGKGEGLMTPHLYHEVSRENDQKEVARISRVYNRHFGSILYGAFAWQENLQHNTFYNLGAGDMAALDSAIEQGLLSHIPPHVRLVDCGAGGALGARKPEKLIRAMMRENGRDISSYAALDKVPSFASTAATFIYKEFNLFSDIVVCDFMEAGRTIPPPVKGKEDYTNLVLLFGGTLANAPDHSPGGGPDSRRNAEITLARMNRQYGHGSMLLMTYHAENDPETLLSEYRPTKELSAFVLSSFSRAVMQGTITNARYDPFQNWHIEPRYVTEDKALKIYAVSRRNHILSTERGRRKIEKGRSLANAVSHKWDAADYRSIVRPAGGEIMADYREEGSSTGVLVVKFVRNPEP